MSITKSKNTARYSSLPTAIILSLSIRKMLSTIPKIHTIAKAKNKDKRPSSALKNPTNQSPNQKKNHSPNPKTTHLPYIKNRPSAKKKDQPNQKPKPKMKL
jgi:hypothetical protein